MIFVFESVLINEMYFSVLKQWKKITKIVNFHSILYPVRETYLQADIFNFLWINLKFRKYNFLLQLINHKFKKAKDAWFIPWCSAMLKVSVK